MVGIAQFSLVALDCPDPRALAEFYAAITGWEPDRDDGDWVQLRSDGGTTLAFQRAPHHRPPVWPSDDRPQQAHLDFDVPDLDAGEEQVLALGARKADVQPGTTFRVYLDPAGHPFCLVLDEQPAQRGYSGAPGGIWHTSTNPATWHHSATDWQDVAIDDQNAGWNSWLLEMSEIEFLLALQRQGNARHLVYLSLRSEA